MGTRAKEVTRIEAARIAAGYSLEDVAKRLRRSVHHVRQMERGTRPTPLRTKEKLSRLYNCEWKVFYQKPR